MSRKPRSREDLELKRHYQLMRAVLFVLPIALLLCIWCIPDLRTGLFVFGCAFVFCILLMVWSGMRRPGAPSEGSESTER